MIIVFIKVVNGVGFDLRKGFGNEGMDEFDGGCLFTVEHSDLFL
jgi:hypothetical protein